MNTSFVPIYRKLFDHYRVSASYPCRKVFVIQNMKEFSCDFMRENSIGGVLCCVDTDAVRIIGRLQKQQVKIGQEISIVNYGNTELTGYFNPAITVIDCGYGDMALQTARLIERGNKAGPLEQHVIFPRLIVRHT